MSEETRNEAPEQELSEILQIRREKLAALQEEGRDPFKLTRFVRSAWSSEIKDGRGLLGHKVGETVTIEAPAGSMKFTILSVENA